jgi:glycine cleavage system aminomethyltransferase T
LDWTVNLDKPEFVGKRSLLAMKRGGPRHRLVPFAIVATSTPVPEGSQVVADGKSVGRVTSCRYSRALSKVIGLVSVPAQYGEPGTVIQIHTSMGAVHARISPELYDPQNERQKP